MIGSEPARANRCARNRKSETAAEEEERRKKRKGKQWNGERNERR